MTFFDHQGCARLAQTGRELASEREDLIAAGADPEELGVPLFYWCRCLGNQGTVDDLLAEPENR